MIGPFIFWPFDKLRAIRCIINRRPKAMSKKRVSSYDDTLFASNGSQHGLELKEEHTNIIYINDG